MRASGIAQNVARVPMRAATIPPISGTKSVIPAVSEALGGQRAVAHPARYLADEQPSQHPRRFIAAAS
jgi:hypothetical protein